MKDNTDRCRGFRGFEPLGLDPWFCGRSIKHERVEGPSDMVAVFAPVCDGMFEQASQGHLVDALAPRGDEGRSTLR